MVISWHPAPKRLHAAFVVLTALALVVGVAALGPKIGGPVATRPLRDHATNNLEQMPLRFETNTGATGTKADFVARGQNLAASFSADQLAIAAPRQEARLTLLGADAHARGTATSKLPGTSNYFVGSDPARWRTDVPGYSGVRYADVYPGIDVSYGSDHGNIESTFTVAPGADPHDIRLSFGGAAVSVGPAGNLVLHLRDGNITRWQRLVAYQPTSHGPSRVAARFITQPDGAVRFALGDFDPTLPLVIDPTITFSTYLGGSDQETGRAVKFTSTGDIVVAGSSRSINFPTLNAARPTYSGFYQDLVVSRIDPSGALVYSTYLGGDGDDTPRDIAIDAAGNAFVTGFGNSKTYPTMNPLQALAGGGGSDMYISELSPTGALLYSSYLGGKGKDGKPHIALGNDGSIYIAGYSSGAFPVTPDAYQHALSGAVDDLFVKLTADGQSIVYATYLGGVYNDTFRGVAIDSGGSAYLAGWTESSDFPVTAGSSQPVFGGDRDGTVTKLDPSGQPVYSTFIGGNGKDGPYPGDSIEIDGTGAAYVTGWASPNFPLLNPIQSISTAALHDVYVAKFDPAGALLFSTIYGGAGTDEGAAIALDAAGNIYVAGTTSGITWPVVNPFVVKKPGSLDGFIMKISPTYQLQYASWFGGAGVDTPAGISVTPAGDIAVAGYTTSQNFPVVNPIQATNHGKNDIFVARLSP